MSGETGKVRARERTAPPAAHKPYTSNLELQIRSRIARLRSRLVDLGDGRRMEREVNRARASLAAKLRHAEKRLFKLKQAALL